MNYARTIGPVLVDSGKPPEHPYSTDQIAVPVGTVVRLLHPERRPVPGYDLPRWVFSPAEGPLKGLTGHAHDRDVELMHPLEVLGWSG